MKSIEKKLIIMLFFIATSSFYSAKTKKNDATMEFYNNLFLQNSESKSNSELKNLKTKKLSKKENEPAASQQKANQADTEKASTNTNKNANNQADTNNSDGILYKGWLKISSALFQLPSLFPPIRIVDSQGRESTVFVKIDNNEFRINENHKNFNNTESDERDFYFKLTNDYFFYSIDEKDINVLQTIPTSIIDKIEDWKVESNEFGKELYSFVIIEKTTKFSFKIATFNKTEMFTIYCKLSSAIEKPKLGCTGNAPINIKSTIIKEEIVQNTILIPIPSKTCNEDWNYENKGDDWECKCKDGSLQSPIDLPKESEAIKSPVSPLFKFDEVNAKNTETTEDGLIKTNEYIKIRYYNNALRILHHNLGKIVTLNQAVYVAEEITFHTPSEHTIDGKRFDMEMQVVFYGRSKGDIAKQVVLSFLFQKKSGFYNKFLDDVDFYTLPNQGFTEREILNNLFIPKVFYSSTGEEDSEQIPVLKPFSFYTYDGSLTMPPCSEDTIHYVASEPIPIASVVLELAKEALRKPNMEEKDNEIGDKRILQDSNEVENYRNIQDRKNRAVFHFDHKRYCGSMDNIVKKKEEIKGHFEKIKRKISEFIYVPGTKPSNIPGAFVVSENEAKNYNQEKVTDLSGF